MPYNNKWSALASSLNSFAGGWAQMSFRMAEQDRQDKNWQKAFDLRKARNDFEMDLANKNFQLNKRQAKNAQRNWQQSFDQTAKLQSLQEKQWQQTFDQRKAYYDAEISNQNRDYNQKKMQWEAEKAFRGAKLQKEMLERDNALFTGEVAKAIQQDTMQANQYIYGNIGSILALPGDKRDDAFVELLAETKASLPNADTKAIEGLYGIVSSSRIATSQQLKAVDTVSPTGEAQLSFVEPTTGKVYSTIAKNQLSDGIVALDKFTREQLQKRRDETMKAFNLGLDAKFGGELSVAVATVNDLTVNAREIINFADKILDRLQDDPEILQMRKKYERELSLLIDDEGARLKHVEALFGPAPSLTAEAHDKTVKVLSKQYSEMMQKEMIRDPSFPGYYYLNMFYEQLLPLDDGRERQWQIDAILAAGKKNLSVDDYTELLVRMEDSSDEYLKKLAAQKQAEQDERQFKQQKFLDENQMDLQSTHLPTEFIPGMELLPSHQKAKEVPWWAFGAK